MDNNNTSCGRKTQTNKQEEKTLLQTEHIWHIIYLYDITKTTNNGQGNERMAHTTYIHAINSCLKAMVGVWWCFLNMISLIRHMPQLESPSAKYESVDGCDGSPKPNKPPQLVELITFGNGFQCNLPQTMCNISLKWQLLLMIRRMRKMSMLNHRHCFIRSILEWITIKNIYTSFLIILLFPSQKRKHNFPFEFNYSIEKQVRKSLSGGTDLRVP